MGLTNTIRDLVRGAVHDLVVVPVVTALDARLGARLDRMERDMGQAYDQAMARFAQVQHDGFELVRARLAEVVAKAGQSGDEALARAAAQLDAGVDSLSAGFAQFAAEAPVEVSAEQLPPVVNPETPAPSDPVPDVAAELPVDPQTVLDDPSIPTPNDPGSAGENQNG